MGGDRFEHPSCKSVRFRPGGAWLPEAEEANALRSTASGGDLVPLLGSQIGAERDYRGGSDSRGCHREVSRIDGLKAGTCRAPFDCMATPHERQVQGDRVGAASTRRRSIAAESGWAASHMRPKARSIFSGVMGCELTRAPKGASASLIAFITAAGAPATPASPAPFAPSCELRVGVCT